MSSRLLSGRYELLEKIGDGGMAVVYKGKDRLLNRFIAIKILRPEFTKDASFVENFKRESQAAAGLSHPNIVSVYDVGKEGNINYIVMELVEGKNLSTIIAEEAPLDYRRVIDLHPSHPSRAPLPRVARGRRAGTRTGGVRALSGGPLTPE